MKTLSRSAGLLIFLASLLALVYFNTRFDTTVPVLGSTDRVHNIGLIDKKNSATTLAIVGLILGATGIWLGRDNTTGLGASMKKCQRCGTRVKKETIRCTQCGRIA